MKRPTSPCSQSFPDRKRRRRSSSLSSSPCSPANTSVTSSSLHGTDDDCSNDDIHSCRPSPSSSIMAEGSSSEGRSDQQKETKLATKLRTVDPERAARLAARAARNRVSAQNSRNRKKHHVSNLEQETQVLRQENAELEARVKTLESLVKTLLMSGAPANGGPIPHNVDTAGHREYLPTTSSISDGATVATEAPLTSIPSASLSLQGSFTTSPIDLSRPKIPYSDARRSTPLIAAPRATPKNDACSAIDTLALTGSIPVCDTAPAPHARLPAAEVTSPVLVTARRGDAQQRAWTDWRLTGSDRIGSVQVQQSRLAMYLAEQLSTAAASQASGLTVWRTRGRVNRLTRPRPSCIKEQACAISAHRRPWNGSMRTSGLPNVSKECSVARTTGSISASSYRPRAIRTRLRIRLPRQCRVQPYKRGQVSILNSLMTDRW